MYCSNCGNKVYENAYVCVKCGVILNKENNNANSTFVKRKKSKSNSFGITSIVFSALALFFCVNCLSTDISEVGMYTEMFDRILYAIGFTFFSTVFMIVSLILALVDKKKVYNKIGLGLSLFSLFLIITEFVVIIIY